MDSRIKMVPVGEYRISNDKNAELFTITASCAALMLHDSKNHIAGMVHIVLPGRRKRMREGTMDAYFADTGVPLLIRGMIEHGADIENLKASLAGGGTFLNDYKGSDIGKKNVEAVTAILGQYRIPIVQTDTGGQAGRRISLNVNTGRLTVQSFSRGQAGDREFWGTKSGHNKISYNILLKKIMLLITEIKPDYSLAGLVLDAVHCDINEIDWNYLFLLLGRNLPLALHVFRIANSPYYGKPGTISSFENALRVLGPAQFRRICVLASVMRQSEGHSGRLEQTAAGLSRHALASALAARHIAEKSGMAPVVQEDTFTAALFHGIGGMVNLVIQDSEISSIDYIRSGTIILSAMKMPDSIISAVASHEYPVNDKQGNPTIASFVHMGCAVSRLLGITSDLEPPVFSLCSEICKSTGLTYELSCIIPEIIHMLKSYGVRDLLNPD